jgi:uncharacterized protein (DUF1330 family)
MKANYKIAFGVIGSFTLGVGAASLLHAQGAAPYYEVAEINVKDQAGYEKSGVEKVRDAIKAGGGKVIAGGYNKSHGNIGAPPANRFLIFQWPNKEASDKVWAQTTKPWIDGEGVKYADFRDVGLDGVEQK